MKKYLIMLLLIAATATFGYLIYFTLTKQASPETFAIFQKNDLSIKVEYCQPSRKGRKIFGGLVPYGQVWRTGANEATEISFSKDVLVGDKVLQAGNYSLFTIPREQSWTIIFNSELGGWGHYNYTPQNDVLRVEVPSEQDRQMTDTFLISLHEKEAHTNLVLKWETTRVIVPITEQ